MRECTLHCADVVASQTQDGAIPSLRCHGGGRPGGYLTSSSGVSFLWIEVKVPATARPEGAIRATDQVRMAGWELVANDSHVSALRRSSPNESDSTSPTAWPAARINYWSPVPVGRHGHIWQRQQPAPLATSWAPLHCGGPVGLHWYRAW